MFHGAYAMEVLLCLLSAIFCLLTGSILAFYSGKKNEKLFLGGFYLSLSYAFIIVGLAYSRILSYFPHLYQTGNICWLLCMPLSWLYIRTAVTHKQVSWKDLGHLLPLLLCLVGEKAAIPIRSIQMTVYWILQVRLLFSTGAAPMRKDRSWFRWMILYNSLQLAMFLPALLPFIPGTISYQWISTVLPVLTGLVSALTLLMHPQILYGLKDSYEVKESYEMKGSQGMSGSQVLRPDKPKPLFDREFAQRLKLQLESVMLEQMPFLNPGYTLKELADSIGVPPYKLSAYINQYKGKNFSDYLNQWRIQYCLDLMEDNQIVNLNLNGIAEKCGFGNRTSFSTAFKKVTGMPPSDYMQAKRGGVSSYMK